MGGWTDLTGPLACAACDGKLGDRILRVKGFLDMSDIPLLLSVCTGA